MPTKLDLAVIAALLAGGLIFIESSHRVDLTSPASAEPGLAESKVAQPDACVTAGLRPAVNPMYFDGSAASGARLRQLAADALPPGCAR